MLETIKSSIKDLPCISFEEYFTSYVMQMQDINIDNEISFLLRNNFLNVCSVDKLVANELRSILND